MSSEDFNTNQMNYYNTAFSLLVKEYLYCFTFIVLKRADEINLSGRKNNRLHIV